MTELHDITWLYDIGYYDGPLSRRGRIRRPKVLRILLRRSRPTGFAVGNRERSACTIHR